MKTSELIKKYNVAAPRYTSYPTVPYWNSEHWDQGKWFSTVRTSYSESSINGISLYIHFPFCESLCTYCGCTTRITKNHKVEEPYISAVLKEWKMYCGMLDTKPVISEIHLGGGTPTFFSAENLNLLITGITQLATLTRDADLSFEGHPANTNYAHLKVLYACGFRRLSLGIQDFDPAVQEIINRKQSFEQVERVCGEAREIGYTSINFDLIYGLPLQKLSSVE
ncbi:MAG: coproporphyrinogen-III oxidase family protein, partial [Daejeonella sp.]